MSASTNCYNIVKITVYFVMLLPCYPVTLLYCYAVIMLHCYIALLLCYPLHKVNFFYFRYVTLSQIFVPMHNIFLAMKTLFGSLIMLEWLTAGFELCSV